MNVRCILAGLQDAFTKGSSRQLLAHVTASHAPLRSVARAQAEHAVLTTLDFTSERARMSVVARAPDGTLRLFCKGSDQALLARLRPGTDADLLAATHGHLRRFSVQVRRAVT